MTIDRNQQLKSINKIRKNNQNNLKLYHYIENKKIEYLFSNIILDIEIENIINYISNLDYEKIIYKSDKRKLKSIQISSDFNMFDKYKNELVKDLKLLLQYNKLLKIEKEILINIEETFDKEINKNNISKYLSKFDIDSKIYSKCKYNTIEKFINCFLKNIKKEKDIIVEKVKEKIQNIYIPNRLFENKKDLFKIQQTIMDVIIITNLQYLQQQYLMITKNENINLDNDELYLKMLEEIFSAVLKFDVSKEIQFVTYFHQRLAYAKQDIINKVIKKNRMEVNEKSLTVEIRQKNIKDFDKMLNKIKTTVDVFKILNKPYSETKKEIVEELNIIINNKPDKNGIRMYRNKFLKEVSEKFPEEYKKATSNFSNESLRTRKLIDYLFLEESLEVENQNIKEVSLEEYVETYELDEKIEQEEIVSSVLEELTEEERKYVLDFLDEKIKFTKIPNKVLNKIKKNKKIKYYLENQIEKG